jgi:predicted acyl esterase
MAQVSKPGEYSGYSPMIYPETVLNSQYVAMRDGTQLAVDILRPAKGGIAVSTPYPVLWVYNWGSRALGEKHTVDNYAELVKYGYVVACADARGCGASYGAMIGSYGRTDQDFFVFLEDIDETGLEKHNFKRVLGGAERYQILGVLLRIAVRVDVSLLRREKTRSYQANKAENKYP